MVKKEKTKKVKSSREKKEKKIYIKNFQTFFVFGIVSNLLASTYFKAILVYVLRFQCNMNENQAIFSFHIFQASSHFSAFLFGIIMTYSPMATIIIMIIFYLAGGGCIGFALMEMHKIPELLPYMPVAIAVFGVGHGAYKSIVPKVFNAQKAGNVFVIISFLEMALEILIIGVGSMFLMGFEVYVFLALYGISVLLVIASSFPTMNDPVHLTEKGYKWHNVSNCTIQGLAQLIAFHASKLGSLKKKKDPRVVKHWLDRCRKKFGNDLVDALITKFALNKLYFWIAGVWMGVEIKYSYWIFATYLTNRQLPIADLVIMPPQYLAIQPLIAILGLPVFVFYLGPALSKSFYNTGARQMCVGAFLILFSAVMSWQLSERLVDVSTEFMQPDFSHTNVRILNGHFCPSGIIHYFPMDRDLAKVVYARPAIEFGTPAVVGNQTKVRGKKEDEGDDWEDEEDGEDGEDGEYGEDGEDGDNGEDGEDGEDGEKEPVPIVPKQNKLETSITIITPMDKDTYLKYAYLPQESPVVGEVTTTILEPTDSFSYMMDIRKAWDNTITMLAYAYCRTLHKHTVEIPINLERTEVGFYHVFLLYQGNGTNHFLLPKVDYRKNNNLKPGVRIYLVPGKVAQPIVLARDNEKLVEMKERLPSGVIIPTDIIWLEVGDGPNLEIRIKEKAVKFTHVLGVAEIVDILVYIKTVGQEDILMAKMLYVDPPHKISGVAPVWQYIVNSLGEFLLGVIGLQYLVRHAPAKMQYFVFMDWYLTLGMSNCVIIIITQFPGLLLSHAQYSYITLIVGTSFFFLVVMASRF